MSFFGMVAKLASGLLGAEKNYVVHGATIKCSKGTDPAILNLPECHGVYIKDLPVMNVADHEPFKNITMFGFCEVTQELCKYQNQGTWNGGKEDVLIDKNPALLSNCTLRCTVGGDISIVHDGQV